MLACVSGTVKFRARSRGIQDTGFGEIAADRLGSECPIGTYKRQDQLRRFSRMVEPE
jgi:hypothetical protein